MKMVAAFKKSCTYFLFFILLSSFYIFNVAETEFQVGAEDGWKVPISKNGSEIYNQWASKNRFKVNDSVHFKYNKDSVMVVTAEEYEKCRSTRPSFFANNGDTIFKLDRPGLFYFVSGVAGHCERGQKMIIKVLETESESLAPSENQNSTPTSPHKNGAVIVAAFSCPLFMISFLIGFLFI